MMKKILAVAIASAFAAPAFAATSNVDVYGVINVGVESVDNGRATGLGNKTRVTTGNNAALGFKGSEDLGGGLKANWQIETNVSIDGDNNASAGTAAGALNGSRNVWGGLSGGWGEVRVGVHDTPYKMSTGRLDSFVATLGDYNTIMGAASGVNASSAFDLRTSNTIAYISPTMGGFQFAGAYVTSTEINATAATDDSTAYSLSATFANGPLFLTAAYEKHKFDGGAATPSGGVILLPNGTVAANDRDAWKIGAGYKFGDLQLGAIYEKVDMGGVNNDHANWMLGADYTIGAIKLKAAYNRAEETTSAANDGAKFWTIGADYNFSKRTMLQVTYADLNNDTGGNYILGQGTNNVPGNAAGADADGFGINLVHRF
ncbi:MAG: porin [Pseudomonadota bacterium]